MRLRVVPLLAAILACAPACKGMGNVMSGFGHVAASAARVVPTVARGVAKAAPALGSGVAQVSVAVARSVGHSAPALIRAGEIAIEAAAEMPDMDMEIALTTERTRSLSPTSPDPCEACPLDLDCGACTGYAGYACVDSRPDVQARCESSAPRDAVPVGQLPEPAPAPPAPAQAPVVAPAAASPQAPPPGS